MAHSRTAKKNIRKSRKRRSANKATMSAMRTDIKRVLQAESPEAAAAGLARAQKLVDKAAKRNQIHPNKAARIKSSLARAARPK